MNTEQTSKTAAKIEIETFMKHADRQIDQTRRRARSFDKRFPTPANQQELQVHLNSMT